MHSGEINDIATALAKAQGQMEAARKDAKNPHLNNKYATLSSIIDASREPLSTNELAFSQILSQGGEGIILETLLMHSSGQWLKSEVLVPVTGANRGVNEAQALGSALTYYKRYALAAMLGVSVADEDDDGNAAPAPPKQEKRQPAKPEPVKTSGNGKPEAETKVPPPTSPKELLALVNSRVLVTYDSEIHLKNAIRQEAKIPGWEFPKSDDRDGWAKAFKWAKDHADAKTSEQPLAA